jgi:hypothetical protein
MSDTTDEKITKVEIEHIVNNVLNDAYKQIQDKIGVKSGDWASIYHSGKGIEFEKELTNFFVQYVEFEKRMKAED